MGYTCMIFLLVFCFAYYLDLSFSQNLYFLRKQNNFVELEKFFQINTDYAINEKHANSIISHHKMC